MNVNLGVLEIAHSIFREWRSPACFDAFWSTIKLVQSRFLVPYFQLFEVTIKLPLATPNPSMHRPSTYTTTLQVRTLPQSSRTAMRRSSRGDLVTLCSLWRGSRHSSRQMYVVVAYHPPVPFTSRLDLSHSQPDEPAPSLPSRVRTGIIEIAKVRASTFLCLFI